jgi:PAS domain S-box-containing protein
VGGAGALAGNLVILSSAMLGILFHYWIQRYPNYRNLFWLYIFGLLVHVSMILLMLTLPSPQAYQAISTISLPVMLIFPVCTVILAGLILDQFESLGLHETLRRSEEKYRELVENANSIILRLDTEINITYFNEYAQSFFGFELDEIKGKNVFGTIVPDIDINGLDLKQQILDISQNVDFFQTHENENICKDGTRVWVNWANRAIKNSNGEVIEYLCIGNDITERITAEKAFREANERYQQLFKSMLDGFALHEIICDENNNPVNYRFLDVNPAFESMTGLSADSIIGKTILDIYSDIEEEWIQRYGKVAIEGTPVTFEHYSKSLNKYFCVSAYQPQPMQFACIVEDITEQKQSEIIQKSRIHLVEYAAQYPTTIELLGEFLNEAEKLTGSEVSFYHGVDDDQMHLNLQAWSKNTFKNMCQAEGDEMHYPIDKAGVWVDCIRERAPVIHNDYESLPHKKGLPEGHAPIVRELVVPVFRGEKIVAVLGVGNKSENYTKRDVSVIQQMADLAYETVEQLRVKEALNESERRFKELLQQMESVAVQGYTMDGTVIYWNHASELIYGYSEKDALGRNLIDLIIPPDMREEVKKTIQWMKVNHKSIPSSELLLVRKDGSRVPVYSSHAFVHKLGGADEFYCFDIDFTDKKESEKALQEYENHLQQSLKMESVGRLAGGVAHDFNNMLGVITGHCDLVMFDLSPDSPITEHIKQIQKAAKRSASLTNQLLAFARKQTIEPVPIDLNQTIEHAIKMLKHLIGENIELVWKPNTSTSPIVIDPTQVDQVLVNLAVNARDAITGTGKIFIETIEADLDDSYCQQNPECIPGNYIVLSVSDTGCGIGQEEKEKLFDPFFTTKPKGQGTGLGLSTVYGIVKQNNGFIDVYSEIDSGSTFKVYFPRFTGQINQVEVSEPVSEELHGNEMVLLVEDNEQLLDVSRAMLVQLGYNVLSTDSPLEAIHIANDHPAKINLLLTDVVMPEMNGRELYQKIQDILPGIHCLFMSGYTDDVIAEQGVLNEGVNYISKPISFKALASKIRKILDGK